MIEERFLLAKERICEIRDEINKNEAGDGLPAEFEGFFSFTADFILLTLDTFEFVESGRMKEASLTELKERNHRLYEDILPDNYEKSYANPAYSTDVLGNEYGSILSFLYSEMRSLIVFAHELNREDMTIRMELFLELYGSFVCAWKETAKLPKTEEIKENIYWFVSDYTQAATIKKLRGMVCPEEDFALRILLDSDLKNERYLYYFGEYVTDNEISTWRHLDGLKEETISLMADTCSEGYRIGFKMGNKDISKKKTVNVRYCLGFERMIRRVVLNFEEMGLSTAIYRAAASILQGKGINRIGYYGAIPNKQFDYDHKDDQALILDKGLVKVRMEALKEAYEKYRDQAALFGGPAVVEVFGETPAELKEKKAALHLSKPQQKLSVEYMAKAAQLQNEYIPGEERSFTIIAFPTPQIGNRFPEIFDEVVRINTLDYKKYQTIQQTIIDTLDQGKYVTVKGMGANKTDMLVALHQLEDICKQSNFENCVADVNIPVGEVFTSPLLKGTEGTLHVVKVYLNGLEYKNIVLKFENGMVTDYTCGNFNSEEDNRKYVKENVLFHHETLPLGEFAIGTNTTAYGVSRKYQIGDKLPILIAEKTGPHFAVGDTCYSHAEEVRVYNPDGREIIAKDNECSLLRGKDPSKAYFNCHTDITIPYDELKEVSVVKKDGTVITIIENGRFVLKGCEELNEPFAEYGCMPE